MTDWKPATDDQVREWQQAIEVLEAEGAYDPTQPGLKTVAQVYDGKIAQLIARVEEQRGQLEDMQAWVDDLQAGTYINCVYCGHRYGPDDDAPAAMADVLKAHIEQCPRHPMSSLKVQLAGQHEEILKRQRLVQDAKDEIRGLREVLELVGRLAKGPSLRYPKSVRDMSGDELAIMEVASEAYGALTVIEERVERTING